MPLPDALSESATARLPVHSDEPPTHTPESQQAATSTRARVRGYVGRVVRRAVRNYDELAAAPTRIDELEAQIRGLHERLAVVRIDELAHSIDVVMVNQELLKGEIREVGQTLGRLGEAIAPSAGLEGAGVRFAELRERVYGLERRLRALVSGAGVAPEAPSSVSRPATREVASDLFDYAGFEQRFRGDPAEMTSRFEARYLEVLAHSAPVLDVGCGRGELVALLGRHGVTAYGIDTDPSLVAEGRAAGLDVRLADVVSHLESLPPKSLGAIVSAHVVEHLALDDLLRYIDLAATRLRPDGVFVTETPNPASLIVLGNSYVLDPTHVRPLHFALLAFLCESAGFRSVDVRFFAPATGYWLRHIEAPDSPALAEQVNAAFDHLNHVLFGSQEYAVIARTAPDTDTGA